MIDENHDSNPFADGTCAALYVLAGLAVIGVAIYLIVWG